MAISSEDRNAVLDEAFPETIDSSIRPETVESDFPFSDKFPPFIAKDRVLFTLTNLVIRQMLSNDKILKAAIDELTEKFTNADIQMVSQTVKGLMSPTDKRKLDGIENNANKYTHPNSGVTPGTYKSVSVNSAGHIVSGSNPTTLAGYGIVDAATKSHGYHVPTPEKTVSNTRFLRNDNTWQSVTPGNLGVYSKVEMDEKIRAGVPDYTAGRSLPNGDSVHTVEYDAFIVVEAMAGTSTEASTASITILADDGTTILAKWYNRCIQEDMYNYASVTGIVKAGQKFKADWSGNGSIKVFPII